MHTTPNDYILLVLVKRLFTLDLIKFRRVYFDSRAERFTGKLVHLGGNGELRDLQAAERVAKPTFFDESMV